MYENWTDEDWKTRIAFVEEDSAEWRAAWKRLARMSGDADFMAEDPQTGEVWQYMGSVRHGPQWQHEFRHRNHPREQKRLLLLVRATRGWGPEKAPPERPTLH